MNNKIDDRILQMFNDRSFDTDFINLDLSPSIKKLLLEYQILHVYNLVSSLKKNMVVVDGSNTGTGKSYTSIATAAQLKLTPIIICPKTIISIWKRVCERFNIKPLCIVNYELLRNGYMLVDGKKTKTKFLEVNDDGEYKWKLGSNNIVIFDEAHKCKNKNSLNGKLLLSLKNITKVMLLSATLSDSPANFHVFGYMLGFYDNMKKAKNWVNGMIRADESIKITNKKIKSSLNNHIFPSKGSRMTLEDIGDKFPKNQISSECYDISDEYQKILENAYKQIENEQKVNNGTTSLVKIIKARKIIELVKIPIFIDLIDQYIESDKSVVVFVNFLDTMTKLKSELLDMNIIVGEIHGTQTIEERTKNIDEFQNDKIRVMLCMIQAGGVGISLNDKNGNYPRVSLISPSFSSVELVQALGRIYRAGTKTPVLQRIIYCANTHEENISDKINNKIQFINKLSDDDLKV